MPDPLSTLDEQQAAAARALQGPVVILAGAGTGKTRTVTSRIAFGVVSGAYQPQRTMALAFTDRAAGELGRRLAQLQAPGVATRTFHSAALRQLRHFWPEVSDERLPRIQANKSPLVKAVLAQCRLPTSDSFVRDVVSEVEWAKSVGVSPERYARHAESVGRAGLDGADRAELSAVLAGYEDEKSERAVIDFEDLLLVTIGMLETRPEIRDRVRRAYRWFTVDEYQDVSPLQQRLLDLWLGDRDDLCVVGDPAQTIYRFAGADQDLLTGFRQRFPDATTIQLTRSYRCADHIVAAANSLAVGIPGARTLTSARPLLAATASRAAVRILQFPDDASEARGVAEEIRGLLAGGTAARDIACLYRANAQSLALQEALDEVGVAFAVRGRERFFNRPEVKEAVTRVRGEARARPTPGAAEAMSSALAAMGHSQDPPGGLGPGRDRWESLAALKEFAARYPADADAAELVAELDARMSDRVPPDPAGVTLASLHSAKGLEWETVFIIGVSDGLLPVSHATDEQALLDELRLFYVGVTRASNHLVVTWSRGRPGSGPSREGSRFLAAMQGDGVPVEVPEPVACDIREAARPVLARSTGLARCSACGRGLVTGTERVLGRCRRCPGAEDREAVARLTDWRDSEARVRGVPPHVLLTNAGVVRVASAMPTSLEELEVLPGMARHKIDDFGPVLLQVLRGGAATGPPPGEAASTGLPPRIQGSID